MAEAIAERRRWDPRGRTVPLPRVLAALMIVVAGALGGLYAFDRLDDLSKCRAIAASNEFREFMSGYLDSQVGVPINEAPGFDELPGELQTLALQLRPFLERGRAADAAFAAQYKADFPIRSC